MEPMMNPALFAVSFLVAAVILGTLLKPTEAEVNARNAAAAPPDHAGDHGHGDHGDHGGHGH
jgi:hypothetical protein